MAGLDAMVRTIFIRDEGQDQRQDRQPYEADEKHMGWIDVVRQAARGQEEASQCHRVRCNDPCLRAKVETDVVGDLGGRHISRTDTTHVHELGQGKDEHCGG